LSGWRLDDATLRGKLVDGRRRSAAGEVSGDGGPARVPRSAVHTSRDARRYINDQDLIGRRPVIASSRQQQQQLRFSSHGDRISRAAAMTAGEFSPSG